MALRGRNALNVLKDLNAVRLELPSTAKLRTDTWETIKDLASTLFWNYRNNKIKLDFKLEAMRMSLVLPRQ